jgi:hypothetical protein
MLPDDYSIKEYQAKGQVPVGQLGGGLPAPAPEGTETAKEEIFLAGALVPHSGHFSGSLSPV